MTGVISESNMVAIWARRIADGGDRPSLFVRRGQDYVSLSWNQIAHDARRLAVGLAEMGVKPGDRVGQLSENRYEWILSDIAIQLAGAVHVPMHAPLSSTQVGQQLSDSQSKVVFISTPQQLQKLADVSHELPPGIKAVTFESCESVDFKGDVQLFNDLLDLYDEESGLQLERSTAASLSPDALATILYTSGTTGEPKGVMLSQRNLVSNALATLEAFGQHEDDRRLGFLPLSHIFARTCDLYTWLVGGTELALAESRDTVLADCAATRPTLLNGVPYFFERVQRHLTDSGQADNVDAFRDLLGGRIRACCSGGAALPNHVHDFFHERGVPVFQGYGLTETSPVLTISCFDRIRRGTVGQPIADVEIKIADDGEILARGPNIMIGFWQRPEATAEVIKDGWFHTGDIGSLDEDGFLSITGRKKELIVTAAGKNVVPVFLESLLCRDPMIEQALVIGDDRKFLSALLVPNLVNLEEELARRGLRIDDKDTLLEDPAVVAIFGQRVEHQLAEVSYHEQVRRFTLIDQPFSVENAQLTPKLSLRRTIIEAHYADRIEAMYSNTDAS